MSMLFRQAIIWDIEEHLRSPHHLGISLLDTSLAGRMRAASCVGMRIHGQVPYNARILP